MNAFPLPQLFPNGFAQNVPYEFSTTMSLFSRSHRTSVGVAPSPLCIRIRSSFQIGNSFPGRGSCMPFPPPFLPSCSGAPFPWAESPIFFPPFFLGPCHFSLPFEPCPTSVPRTRSPARISFHSSTQKLTPLPERLHEPPPGKRRLRKVFSSAPYRPRFFLRVLRHYL